VSIELALSPTVTSTALPAATGKKDSSARIQRAATEFESFLLAQMLKSAREASGGGLGGDAADDSGANSTMIELGEQQFAQALASSGGLGIAKMVVTGLAKYADR
jgi:Rod binding domain-containing protein